MGGPGEVNTSDGCRFEVRLPTLAGAPASP